MAAPSALPSRRRSVFPPIPAPLQRLFDLVPIVVYPANALPGDDAYDNDNDNDDDDTPADDLASPLPTLFVFIDPADARRGRASFNPTCLKWQTFLRFAGVPVRLVASSNHASPTGALPFLQPPRQPEQPRSDTDTPASAKQAARQKIRLPPPPRPIPTSDFAKYARKTRTAATATAASSLCLPTDSLAAVDPRAPAYQALLDTNLRRAWLHAVYLDQGSDDDDDGHHHASIASRLYADAASSSRVVRASLAGQLQAAAASEVWGTAAAAAAPTATAVAQIYTAAQAALSALSAVLEENDSEARFFFNCEAPTIFDAAVFSYTHLLLEDDDADAAESASPAAARRFRWHNTTLPDLVKAHPRLVQHRNRIVSQSWATAPAVDSRAGAGPDVADSVSWVRI